MVTLLLIELFTYQLCTLLETCGRYFAKGTAKRKLDRFLVFFQRYMMSKPSLTMDMEFDIADLFERLRPDLKRFVCLDKSEISATFINKNSFLL